MSDLQSLASLGRRPSNLSGAGSGGGRRLSNAGSAAVAASLNVPNRGRRATAGGGMNLAPRGSFAVTDGTELLSLTARNSAHHINSRDAAIVGSSSAPHEASAQESIINALSDKLRPRPLPTHVEEAESPSSSSSETLVDVNPFGAAVISNTGRCTCSSSMSWSQLLSRDRPKCQCNVHALKQTKTWRSQQIDYEDNMKKATTTDQEFLNYHHIDTYSNEEHLVSLKDLFRPLIVRQWLHNGKLYREADQRTPCRFELFWDLLIVAIVHVLADKAAENISGNAVLRFFLVFNPVYSIWSDMRTFTNQSGTDDVVQRCFILWNMLLLIGYTASAAVIINPHELLEFAESVAHAAVAEGSSTTEEPSDSKLISSLSFPYIRAAIAFFVVAKFSRMFYQLAYFYHLPAFRMSYFFSISLTFITTMFVFAIMFHDGSYFEKCALVITSILCDLLLFIPVMLYARIHHKKIKKVERDHKKRGSCPFSKAADMRLRRNEVKLGSSATEKKTFEVCREGTCQEGSSGDMDLEKQDTTALDTLDPNFPEHNENIKECFKAAQKNGLYHIAINIEHA
ncbi:hypothetical protein BT69DRAFT_1337841, partial [Atractiella rhizophila]